MNKNDKVVYWEFGWCGVGKRKLAGSTLLQRQRPRPLTEPGSTPGVVLAHSQAGENPATSLPTLHAAA